MKLRLPNKLVAALMAAMSATVFTTLSTGSFAYADPTTYNDLTAVDYFETNEYVYNTGKGTFYLETPTSTLSLTLTLNLNDFAAYQTAHDYGNAGYYSNFVTWTYNNNPGTTYGMADVASGYSDVNYSGVTGMWNGRPWTTGTNITFNDDFRANYADADGNVTLTITNNPTPNSGNVVVEAVNKTSGATQTLYTANGLRSSDYANLHVTAFTVNMNYVKSVTLNSESILDSSDFTAPKDYTIAFDKTQTESVGRVVFLGDSITHGVQDMSYRWDIFKTFVDNGIENEIAGPLSGYNSEPLNSDYNGDFSSSTYGGATFDNVHYAQASGRTHNMLTASGSGNSLGGSTGVNYSGVTSVKVGKEYNGDTYIMMMGTNDILSDGADTVDKMATVTNRLLGEGSLENGTWTNAGVEGPLVGLTNDNVAYRGEWGTIGKIIDNMKMDEGDTMYVMSIPTWAEGRQNIRVYAPYVAEYNEKLELWTKAYSDTHTGTIKYVDINRGLIDKTLGGDFLGPNSFFRTVVSNDYIHPNEQGALIIAGNLAQGMGIAGRTAGLARSAADGAGWTALGRDVQLNSGESERVFSNVFTEENGYSVDFSAIFGNGDADGWLNKNNALSIYIGDGTNAGALKLSEGYISWNDKLLFCQDNSLESNDRIRVAYHNGNAEQNISSGYYVWLGDMLIGQGLGNESNLSFNGVTVYAAGADAAVKGLSYANTAYAPTSELMAGTPLTTTQAVGNTSVIETGNVLLPLLNHNNKTGATLGVNFSADGVGSVDNGGTAATNATAGTAVTVVMAPTDGFYGAVKGYTRASGDVTAKVTSSNVDYNAFGVVNGGLTTGNITMVFGDGVSVNSGSYDSGNAQGAFLGAFKGDIGGKLAVELQDATMKGNVIMGVVSGDQTVGSTQLLVNGGATIEGNVYGGSIIAGATITNDIDITVTGGSIKRDLIGTGTAGTVGGDVNITITGGTIGGNVTARDSRVNMTKENATANLTVEGNLAKIGGNISADNITFRNVETQEYSDTFDKFSGSVTAADTLTLDHYTAAQVGSSVTAQHVVLSGNSSTTIRDLTLTACTITAEDGSDVTLEGTLTLGNTATYTGTVYVADGLVFSMNGEAVAAGETVNVYSAGVSGFLTEATVLLKPADASRLKAVGGASLTEDNVNTYVGADALADYVFNYNSTTGVLAAASAIGGSGTFYVNDAVTYDTNTPAYTADDFVIGNGGNLTLNTNLKDGVTVAGADASTTSTITVGSGVTLLRPTNSVTDLGNIASYVVNEGGVLDWTGSGNAGNTTINLSSKLSGAGTVKVVYGNGDHNGELRLGSTFTGIADVSGNFQLKGSTENSANTTFYLHDGESWYNSGDEIANDFIFGSTYTLRPSSNSTFSGVLTSKEGDTEQNLILGYNSNNDKNKTITFSNAGAANINKVTLAYDDLTLQQANDDTGKTLYTGDIVVNAGRKLSLTPRTGAGVAGGEAETSVLHGGVWLNGTSGSQAKVYSDAKAFVIEGGVHLAENGFGKLEFNNWGNAYIHGLTGQNSTLDLWRNYNGGNEWATHISLQDINAGDFSGHLNLRVEKGTLNAVVIGSPQALASTVVNFNPTGGYALGTYLAFADSAADIKLDSQNRLLYTSASYLTQGAAVSTFGNGAVAGLQSADGSNTNQFVFADSLTINTGESRYEYNGNMNVNKIVLMGTGSQAISTMGLTIGNKRVIGTDGGEQGDTNAFTKIFKGESVTATEGAHLILKGNVNFNDSTLNSGLAQIYSGLNYLEVTGNFQANTWGAGAAWHLLDHEFVVGGNLWLTNKQTLLAAGGTLTVSGNVLLGHSGNGGDYPGHLNLSDGSTFSAAGIGFYGPKNSVTISDSSITFTGETVLSQLKSGSWSNNTVTLTNDTLKSTTSAWNLTAISGSSVTVAGTTKLNIASGKDITLGSATISGSLAHESDSAGTLKLVSDTLNGVTLSGGAFAISGTTVLGGTVKVQQGASLSLAGTAQINADNLNRFEMTGTTPATYNGTGIYEGSGFRNENTYYLVKNGGTITGELTATGSLTFSHDEAGNYTFTTADTSTYYVNSNLDYNNDVMGTASTLFIADNVTLSATNTAAPSAAKVLTGSGTFDYNAASTATVPNVTVGAVDDWTGTVVLRGLSKSGSYSLNNYGNAASWVQMTGVTGYDDNWSGHLTVNLILEDDGDTKAWNYSAAASAQNYMSVDGLVKGTGTLNLSATSNNQWVSFTNDISEWTGAITSANATKYVAFTDAAREVNVAITKTGGAMNVIAGNDITFNNTVQANTLTATGKTVTLGSNTKADGTVTHGDLSLSAASDIGKLVINDGATATITHGGSSTGFTKNTVDINAGGTLKLANSDTLGWGSNSTAAINMQGETDKHATMTVSDKQTFCTTLNMNGYADVKNADGATNNAGLEIYQHESTGPYGTINASGVGNTISTKLFLRNAVTVTAAADAELTISGAIGVMSGVQYPNSGSLIKEGEGTLTLSGANTFSGDLRVNAGTLKIGSDSNTLGAMNSSRNIVIAKNAVLDVAGYGSHVSGAGYTVTLDGGTLTNSAAGTGLDSGKRQLVTGLKLTKDSTILANNKFGLIASSYDPTTLNLGAYTLEKMGTDTYYIYNTTVEGAGALKATEGELNFGKGGTLASDIVMHGGRVTGTLNLADDVTVTATAASTLGAAIATTTSETAHSLTLEGAEDLTLSGNISGGGALIKNGTNTVTLSGSNTFSGDVNVNNGTLKFGSGTALGANIRTQNPGDRTITIGSGATVDVNGKTVAASSYTYVLDGGKLVNNGSATSTGHAQNNILKLTADSEIGGSGDFYLIAQSYNDTSIQLQNHTLTKTGGNRVGLYSTAVSGGGTLRVEAGELNFLRMYNDRNIGSMNADLVMAGSTAAVTGDFTMAGGHSISTDGVSATVAANIVLQGNTTLSADGANTLTLSGVLSGTGSLTKTGTGAAVLGAANTFTGMTYIQHGSVVGADSNALQNSVIAFTDGIQEDRVLSFEANNAPINGTIAGLDGYRGMVKADTLTINVAEGGNHEFLHRYDGSFTLDKAVLQVNGLVKRGAGTQVIGGEYTTARGFTADGLVIANGVDVQQGTLHMKTRGIVTANFDVQAGATLLTTDDNANKTSADAAGIMTYNGKMTLHGTAENTATLHYADGSNNITGGIYVDGYGTVINKYDKNQFIGGLFNAEGTTSNDISFNRPDSRWDDTDSNFSAAVITASGNFTGTVHVSNGMVKDNGTRPVGAYGLQVLGAEAQDALAGAVVDFTGDNVSVLSFRSGNTAIAQSDDAWTTNKMDGSVAGLTGTNGAVYANGLTINTAADSNYNYGGTLDITGLTKTGTGTQTLSGTGLSLGTVAVNGGTLALTGTAANMASFTSMAIANGATLDLTGVTGLFQNDAAGNWAKFTDLASKATGAGTVLLPVSGANDKYQIMVSSNGGNATLSTNYVMNHGVVFNNYYNYSNPGDNTGVVIAKGGSLTVNNGALKLASGMKMTLNGGSLTAHSLILGHGDASQNYFGSLTMNSGAMTLNGQITAAHGYTGNALNLLSGTFTYNANDNVFANNNDVAVTIGGTEEGQKTTLVADGHGWTLNHDATLNKAELNTVGKSDSITFAAGSTVNLGEGASLDKVGAGTANLSGTLSGTFAQLAVKNGTLAFTGLSDKAAEENINNLHVSTATVSDSSKGTHGQLVAGDATLTARPAPAAQALDDEPVTNTGTLSNAVFTQSSLSGDNGSKGTMDNSLLSICDSVSYSITEMNLNGSVVNAENAELNMQNVSIDATSGVVANGGTLTGENRLTLSAGEGIKDNVTVSSDQLKGLTLTNGNLTLDLSAHGYAAGAKIGDTFHIELSDFSWEDMVAVSMGDELYNTKSGADLNTIFKVLALGSTDSFYKVLSVTQGVSDGNGGFATGITLNVEVPEPTTSVLSLLALAGMAARRRRK